MNEPHQVSQRDVWRSTTVDSGVQSVMIALELQRHVLLADNLASPRTSHMELWVALLWGKIIIFTAS